MALCITLKLFIGFTTSRDVKPTRLKHPIIIHPPLKSAESSQTLPSFCNFEQFLRGGGSSTYSMQGPYSIPLHKCTNDQLEKSKTFYKKNQYQDQCFINLDLKRKKKQLRSNVQSLFSKKLRVELWAGCEKLCFRTAICPALCQPACSTRV